MQKSENDYIAEYIKQKHPELLQSLDFLFWKAGHILSDALKTAADAIVGLFKGLSGEDMLGARRERGRMKNIFTINDAIGQCEAMAAALEKGCHDPDSNLCKYASIAAEKRQMAAWLRELKVYRNAKVGCEYCKHKYREPHEKPCSLCKRNFVDMFERADDEGSESE